MKVLLTSIVAHLVLSVHYMLSDYGGRIILVDDSSKLISFLIKSFTRVFLYFELNVDKAKQTINVLTCNSDGELTSIRTSLTTDLHGTVYVNVMCPEGELYCRVEHQTATTLYVDIV